MEITKDQKEITITFKVFDLERLISVIDHYADEDNWHMPSLGTHPEAYDFGRSARHIRDMLEKYDLTYISRTGK